MDEYERENRKYIEAKYVLKRVSEGRWKHGTAYCYNRLGCRLPECREAELQRQKRVAA